MSTACWSAENATKAYLKTLKMGQRAKEPDSAEYISALAGGSNAQLMVVACATVATSTTAMALLAAAQQTSGRVVCIFQDLEELETSIQTLTLLGSGLPELVVGDPQTLLLNDYKEADFVLLDCKLDTYDENFQEIRKVREHERSTKCAIIVGYNALCKGSSWERSGTRTHLLPIGSGLLVTRIGPNDDNNRSNNTSSSGDRKKKSRWIVKVDKCTGEEHVFRVRLRQRKQMEACIF